MSVTRDELINSIVNYAADDYSSDQLPFVEECVDDAIAEVCNEMCPWPMSDDAFTDVMAIALSRYPGVIRQIAKYHYDKQGKEGVTTFYEAGQTTSFEDGGTPRSFFKNVIPIARVCK